MENTEKVQRGYHPEITTHDLFVTYPTVNEFKSILLLQRILFWKPFVNSEREAKHKQLIGDHRESRTENFRLPPLPSLLSTNFLLPHLKLPRETASGKLRSNDF